MSQGKPLDVLVYGATGTQARPTVTHLLARGHRAHVITRSAKSGAELAAAGAELLIGEMTDAKFLASATRGKDAVAFLLPTFIDDHAVKTAIGCNAVDAAAAANISVFVWNTSGALPDPDSAPDDPKVAVFARLRAHGIPYVLLEPTTYLENLLGPWTAPNVASRDQLSYPVLAERKIGWLACHDMGALVVAALERPELAGSRFPVSGIETPTGPELAAIFSRALGREIAYYAMSPEEMGAVIDRIYGPGTGDSVAEMYRREQHDPHPEPKYHDMAPVLDKLPVDMTRIESWVTRHAGEFQSE